MATLEFVIELLGYVSFRYEGSAPFLKYAFRSIIFLVNRKIRGVAKEFFLMTMSNGTARVSPPVYPTLNKVEGQSFVLMSLQKSRQRFGPAAEAIC
jgi:hypothetical protein